MKTARGTLQALAVTILGLLALAPPSQAAFPGKNGKIAYSAYVDGVGHQVQTVQPDGTGRAALFAGLDPAWSADGTRLAFTNGNVFTARPDGSERIQVTNNHCDESGCSSSYSPSWSPTGDKLVIQSLHCVHQCDYPQVDIHSADGSGREYLDSPATDPAWSPDGTIAYVNYKGIATIAPGRYAELTDNYRDSNPSWSPDGTKIVFVRAGEIFVMNADGTNQIQLTHNLDDRNPAWSPDGSRIVYSTFDGSQRDLHTIRPDGTGDVNITNSPDRREEFPDWQPVFGPQRSDYKNTAQFCKAFREFLGEEDFRNRYGGGANAHGKCVSGDGQ